MAPPSVDLETADIQGLVVRGYGSLKAARFLLLHVLDADRARAYLRTICGQVNTAKESPHGFARQIAFTAPGLAALGVPKTAWDTFSREFLEGMDDSVRSDALGDRDKNDPSNWTWGRKTDALPIHAMVMLYATEKTLDGHVAAEEKALDGAFRVVVPKDTTTLDDNKEHFGWRDGLSMPKITGVTAEGRPTKKKEQEWWTAPIAGGDFVLGYPNEYECLNESPMVDPADDPANHLPEGADGLKDLGKNGTYLVYREMTQDVPALWQYLARSTLHDGAPSAERAIALGAKMVGRWPSGAPLITSPDDHKRGKASDNKFLYSGDLEGLQCPIGAHIRRANPRDDLAPDRDAADSTIMVKKHQMIRRGRPFGPPLAASMKVHDIFDARETREPPGTRGLHFICLVGHIGRQFEFVQRAWIHSANFHGLYKDGDPISAGRRPLGDENENDQFTCPAKPVRKKYKEMPQFTMLVGGGYFFLPSIRALKFISRHP